MKRTKYMTVEDVETRIEEIRLAAKDYEKAHGLKDELYHDVLECIATTPDDIYLMMTAPNIAAAALKTKDIDFPRYTA